ncbi:OmpA domain protein [Citrifermentans bremense]|uniref:OmpA domain protein n=2 Tax=Citrifermentans bremense TaxID=60035 RepID=A0A7R7FTF5_9BACT|nr:OmpA family protein [Citrifermentans bremense]BCO11539.1 OmpA domain protein [Citrifermentans bremense]
MNAITRVLTPPVLIALLLILHTQCLAADKYDSFTTTPVVGIFMPGSFNSLKPGLMTGVKIDKQLTDAFGIEGDFSMVGADAKSSGSTTLYLATFQTIYPFLERPNLTPFLTFGAGGVIADKGSSSPLVNFGLGAKYFIKKDVAVRFDFRDVAASSLGNSFELTAGVSFVFGGEKKQPRRRPRPQIAAATPMTNPASTAASTNLSTPTAKDQPVVTQRKTPKPVPASPASTTVATTPQSVAVSTIATPGIASSASSVQPSPVAAEKTAQAPRENDSTETTDQAKQIVPGAEKKQASTPSVPVAAPLLQATFEFDLNSYKIKPSFTDVGRKIGLFMKRNPQIIAQIHGHADITGSDDHNLALSEKRAVRTKQYLMKMYNLSAERFEIRTMGSSEPIADNTTEVGRKKNRRALVIILK